MNIIFMTNSEFSFPSLEILMKSDHNILSLVTNPPEDIGRKRKYSSNTIILKCEELGIDTIEQKDLNDISFEKKLTKYESDLFVIVAYRILPKSLLDTDYYNYLGKDCKNCDLTTTIFGFVPPILKLKRIAFLIHWFTTQFPLIFSQTRINPLSKLLRVSSTASLISP